ncbi:restriction endonuclease subunit S, partial [Thiolapillus sp.]
KKVQALKQHKKGLMQQLFPAEGETTPRLRFPEFREAGAWDKQRIGDLLSLEYGAPLPEGSRLEGDIPVIGSNGVVGYHSEPLIKGPAIVIGRKGSAGQVSWIDSPCYPIDTTFFVDLSRKDCQLRFIYLLLERHRLQELVREGGVPGLNRDDVYAVKATISKHTEQQKIAHCLSSLDDVIGLESHKLDALKNLKKGLMQQLFPQDVP